MSDKSTKSSGVWEYFQVKSDDVSKCQCLLCKRVISRGRPNEPKKFSTSALLTHLRSKHQKENEEMRIRNEEAKKKTVVRCASTSATTSQSQPTIQQQFQQVKSWDINSTAAMKIHRAIAQMIITDMEPYYVVEKRGDFTILLSSLVDSCTYVFNFSKITLVL